MNTYDYELVTDAFTAKGQVDAVDEAAAESILRDQVANPLQERNSFIVDSDKKEPKPPKVKSVDLKFKTKVKGIADKPNKSA